MMNEHNDNESLRAELADLKAERSHDTETRQQLLSATERLLPALINQQQQWEARHMAHLKALRHAPELERLREEGLLPKFALLATRQRALEEEHEVLSGTIIETLSDIVRELADIVHRALG